MSLIVAALGFSLLDATQPPGDPHRKSIGDARYESEFIRGVRLVPIPSLWGHSAGSGGNAADNDFIDGQVRQFLK